MKKITGLLTLLFLNTLLFGQENSFCSVQGKVLDEQLAAMGYVNILLLNPQDSSLVHGTLTDEKGDYSLTALTPGNYLIMASMVGMENTWTPVFSLNAGESTRQLEPLVLKASQIELATVEVKGEKPFIELKGDRIVMNVENSPVNTGNNALEVLARAPAVTVDQNDRISLKGKQGVLVIINGKNSYLSNEELARMLASMPAESIESIEIMHNPPAKYDAAGNAGIINIVLKKDKNLGFNGSVQLGLGQGRYTRGNGGLRLNYREKKFNLFGNYNYYQNKRYQDRLFSRSIPFPAGTNVIDQDGQETNNNHSHSFQTGADWFVNDNATLGILLKGNTGDWGMNATTRSDILGYNPVPYDRVSATSAMSETWDNLSGNFNWSQKLTGGQSLNFDADYSSFENPADQYYENYFLDNEGAEVAPENNFRNLNNSRVEIKALKVDYNLPLSEKEASLDLGMKYSDVNTDNILVFDRWVGNTATWENDALFSNQFMYSEQILAAYANYSQNWEKWQLQAGLRMENTQSTGDSPSRDKLVNRKYINLFPSVNLSRTLNENNQMSLSYSRRIDRPTYQNLNPFFFFLDQFTYGKGNPFLQPQYINKVRFSHTWKYSFTTSVSYSRVNDFFAQVTEPDGETRNFINTRNVANENTYNIGVSTPVNITNWWGAYVNVYAYYQSYEATDPAFQAIDRWTGGGYAQTTFTLPWDLSLELSGWFQSPSIWGGTYRTNSLGAVNVAVQKSIADRWSLRLAANDIFFTSPWVADMEFGGLVIDGTGGSDSRQFKINLSYRFGSSDVKRQRNRETGLDDAQDRIGG